MKVSFLGIVGMLLLTLWLILVSLNKAGFVHLLVLLGVSLVVVEIVCAYRPRVTKRKILAMRK